MIGNDLVDRQLAATESNWKRNGWLDKILTKEELVFLESSRDKEMMIWVLWSCKEAAYKIYNRNTKIRAFMPLGLECLNIKIDKGFYFGEVRVMGFTIHTKTTITKDYIHTVAVSEKYLFDEVQVDFSDLKNQHNSYKIEKDSYGIPYIVDHKTGQKKIVSISNHGRFCSYIST